MQPDELVSLFDQQAAGYDRQWAPDGTMAIRRLDRTSVVVEGPDTAVACAARAGEPS